MNKKITVAGCGVIGLTTAITLLKENHEVEIVTKELPANTTSNRAAAFWFPYHLRDSQQILGWSMISYKMFEKFSEDPKTGVYMTPLIKLGNEVSEIELRIKQSLPPERFRPLEKAELKGNFENGWHIQVPLIETPVYLPFLFNTFLINGGKISEYEINSFDELIDKDSIVINCTGLGSRKLADDDQIIPIRGQIVFLESENLKRIILEESAPSYIVYRTDGCICGGSYEENIYSTNTDATTIQNIIDRCIALEPGLKKSAVIDSWSGLRPYRSEIRVERDNKKRLIHNYGHGGSGFTVSWGCAERVAELVNEFK